MKDLFTIPKAEICKISCNDVVCTSPGFDSGDMDPTKPGVDEQD